ncbi:LTA synthase family protein [Crocinitomix catalasitica]|nr:LTA synthase family protein [Crocinitomix catalasitica]
MVYFTDFLAGIWFDFVTAAIVCLPLVLIEMFPNKLRGGTVFQKILAVSFHLILFLSTFINLIDVEYFRHTSSRSTVGLFKMLGFGDDLWSQLPSFFADYWYIIIFAVLFQFAGIWLYKRINRVKDDSRNVSWVKQIILFPIACGLLVLIGRGGIGMKPIAPANGASYTIDQNVQLVLNSAFTVIKTWGDITIDEKNYFDDKELKKLFNPRKNYSKEEAVLSNPNIVILTLESFSVEYISEINSTEEVYTPFLDSLIRESLVYTNCYANGKKSMDAMPSIISSIPKLMEIEYLTSPYAANRIEAIPKLLKSRYYSSGFFHGASNGSMSFDTFADAAGFDDYYGRDEYDNDDHYDGTWGIYDEEFYLWTIEQLDKMKKPFFSTVFSISSHPPYTMPERYRKRFNAGPTEMHNSIRYADYALSQFFKSVKKKEWYANTLFIIVADHTPATSKQEYYKERGNMHIPLVFHYANHPVFKGRNEKIVSQVDIMPSIMHLIGYEQAFFSFGQSVFKKGSGFSCSQIGEKQIYFGSMDGEDYLLMLSNDEISSAFLLQDIFQLDNLKDKRDFKKLEDHFKAIIQTFNHALINNKMTIEN